MAYRPQKRNTDCLCKNGATGATGPAGMSPEWADDLFHIVENLPADPLPGNLYFAANQNKIYLGGILLLPIHSERFAFTIQTNDGTFEIPVSKHDAGIPYNWNIYLDDVLYTTANGVSGTGVNFAATVAGLNTEPHEIAIEPVPDAARAVPDGWLVAFGADAAGLAANMAKLIGCNSKISKKSIAANNTTIADDALEAMFFRASNLVLGDDFGLADGCADFIDAGNFVARNMFHLCGFTTLPEGFDLPRNLQSVGENFAENMFYGCPNLTELPSSFNLPQNLATVGNNFGENMFYDCPVLSALQDDFNLPQSLASVGYGFAHTMFSDCPELIINNAFQLVDVFRLGGETAYYRTFYNMTQAQTRTAESIIQSITATYATHAFQNANGFDDLVGIPTNWK